MAYVFNLTLLLNSVFAADFRWSNSTLPIHKHDFR